MMLSNLQIILLFVFPIVQRFKKVFMHRLAMDNIVFYRITIISNILNKMANYIKLKIVKG